MKSHPDLLTPNCLDSGQLIMPGSDFLRYGLAEALVRREFASGLPFDIAHAAPVAHTDVRESDYLPKPGKKLGARELSKLQEQRTQAIAVRTLSIYSECVVRANAAAALRLELSASNSAQEAEAFAAMNEGLSSCLPTGETIRLDKTALRGAVAMSLYRLAHNPPASLTTPP